MPFTILMYGDCTSYNGRIKENVGLERFHCIYYVCVCVCVSGSILCVVCGGI